LTVYLKNAIASNILEIYNVRMTLSLDSKLTSVMMVVASTPCASLTAFAWHTLVLTDIFFFLCPL
jgi:hypothetical protein